MSRTDSGSLRGTLEPCSQVLGRQAGLPERRLTESSVELGNDASWTSTRGVRSARSWWSTATPASMTAARRDRDVEADRGDGSATTARLREHSQTAMMLSPEESLRICWVRMAEVDCLTCRPGWITGTRSLRVGPGASPTDLPAERVASRLGSRGYFAHVTEENPAMILRVLGSDGPARMPATSSWTGFRELLPARIRSEMRRGAGLPAPRYLERPFRRYSPRDDDVRPARTWPGARAGAGPPRPAGPARSTPSASSLSWAPNPGWRPPRWG